MGEVREKLLLKRIGTESEFSGRLPVASAVLRRSVECCELENEGCCIIRRDRVQGLVQQNGEAYAQEYVFNLGPLAAVVE